MILNTSNLNRSAFNAANCASNICKDSLKVFFTHLHTCALNMEYYMNVYF